MRCTYFRRIKSDWTTVANALVQTVILVFETPDITGHSVVLVVRAQKVVREAARGEVRRDLRIVDRAADSGDPGTY